ncbi:two pore channel protein 1-like [Schistocerca americana]|uniref:two pore channel protein 1-like n=1 Tax=Schistocerca americana TaxID=7009 RepID=UPI001F4F3772|nr:two pore channel protein 1-like [Schistocerca americana]XP_047097863.1 two pore channel protein 1-like [Schistocerca piceifrons]
MASGKGVSPTADGYTKFDNDNENVRDTYSTENIKNGFSQAIEDFPNEIGSTSSLNRDVSESSVEISNRSVESALGIEQHWEMNFHEAAIFLEEGENNEKFDSHPCNPEALPAYLLVHNRWYYGLDMIMSLVLLALAFVEEPAASVFRLPVGVHGSIELLALIIIGVELLLKLRWIGWRTILKHKRTMIKCVTLGIMFVEAVTVLVRQSSHFRVTRALRPIFLVDTRHCGGVRRFIRQILQSLPPILDMLGLLLFFVTTYALLGYFLFSDDPRDQHFSTLQDSFVSMFVLLTTANFPDVMMPAYSRSMMFCIFFISYLCIVLYVLMNLMLAVVYETFTRVEREKFRKLLLHKRKACQHAFRLLVAKQNPHRMRFRQFEGLMRYYAPKKTVRDVVLMFKYLNSSGSGTLSLEEFYSVYDAVLLCWEPQFSQAPWFHTSWAPLQNLCQLIHDLVLWKYFEHIIYGLIICNGISMAIRITELTTDLEESACAFAASWDTILFVSLGLIEALLKILGLGVSQYFSSGWNSFDFSVTLATLCAVTLLTMFPWMVVLIFIRPLRLLRLFKLKKRYRDVFGTLVLLTPLMCSTAIVMLVLYYFFAIIGMELFAGYDMRNCCVNTTVEDFYKYSANGSTALGYYYLNTFENLMKSSVTLFELTVVNNWFILMNGYASVASPWSRIYFMLFYLSTMIVLTIVVASVLEAFRFRIQYKRQTTKREEEKMLHEEVDVKWEELQMWVQDFQLLEKLRADLVVDGTATYIGCRPRNREVLQRRMYRAEIEDWMHEAEMVEQAPTPVDGRSNDHAEVVMGGYQQNVSINS